MTSISRDQFVTAMARAPLTPSQLPGDLQTKLGSAGLPTAEIEKIGGTDHIVNTEAEANALYDRLVQMEAAPAAKGGSFDYAKAMYDARTQAQGGTSGPPPTSDLLRMRPRPTGVFAKPTTTPSLLPTTAMDTMMLVPRSSLARTVGSMGKDQLEPQASQDVLGPAAGASRRIESLTNKAVAEIESLETRAKSYPKGSPERVALEDQAEARLSKLESDVSSVVNEYKVSGSQKAEGPLLDKLKSGLPPYVKESIEREGVVIPGMPGAIQPNTKTPGANWILKF